MTSSSKNASPERAGPCTLCGQLFARHNAKMVHHCLVCRDCHSSFFNRRIGAFAIDLLLVYIVVRIVLIPLNTPNSFLLRISGILSLSLMVFRDGFAGMSPGRWLFDLRVLNIKTRQPTNLWQSIKRNIWLGIPGLNTLVILLIPGEIWDWGGQRLGDDWAGTLVVWCKHADKPPFNPHGLVCLKCGYNLTGNVSGICPECGTAIPETTRRRIASAQATPIETGITDHHD